MHEILNVYFELYSKLVTIQNIDQFAKLIQYASSIIQIIQIANKDMVPLLTTHKSLTFSER